MVTSRARHRAGSRRRTLVAGGGALLFAFGWGCNAILGLDDVARPLRGDDDAATEAAANVEAGPPDDAARASDGHCFADLDCPVLDPCLTPRCEVSTGRCLYATCQPRACERAACSTDAPHSCTQTSEPYGAVAGDLGLPGVAFGCGSDATACFAGVYPYAFLGTTTGVIAIALADLKPLEPPRLTVDLPFAPEQILASGDVVYFRGPVSAGKIALAALRVQADPRAAHFTPTAVVVEYPFASARLLPAAPGEVLLAFDDASKGFPSATLDATLRGGKAIAYVPPPVEAGAPLLDAGAATAMYGAFGGPFGDPEAGAPERIATSSIESLLLVQSAAPPHHALLTGPGTPNAAIGGTQDALSFFVPQDYQGPIHYATAPNGAVLSVGVMRAGFDGTHFRTGTYASWLVDPGLGRVTGYDYAFFNPMYYDYDGGMAYPTPIPYPPRALALDAENAFFVITAGSTSPSGLTVTAMHRVVNGSVAFYPGKPVVFDDPTEDTAPGTIGIASASDLVLVVRKTAAGAKILAIDTRCAPK